MKKAWVTTYALTTGILEVSDASRCYFPKGDVHSSMELAIAAANGKRLAKIASLRKQIEKLEKMATFKVKVK